jgi:hypothetical protein
MNKEQEQIMMGAYRQYSEMSARKLFKSNTYQEFINKCKTDSKFAENWGLQIEERELTWDESNEYYNNHQSLKVPYLGLNVPIRLITITYNDKTIESYE